MICKDNSCSPAISPSMTTATTAFITPPPSADIAPRDPCSPDIAAFALPPAATASTATSTRSTTSGSRKRSSSSSSSSKLPPPPMRSRRIIQMQPVLPKPGKSRASSSAQVCDVEVSTSSHSSVISTSATASTAVATTTKRRSNGSTAATRKTARKIAHSAIERRRRSKMNEEFDSLKIMVPACRVASQTHGDASLHKLGILQATVEYVRYLEECISQLQNRVESLENGSEPQSRASPEYPQSTELDDEGEEEVDDDDEDEDEDEIERMELASEPRHPEIIPKQEVTNEPPFPPSIQWDPVGTHTQTEPPKHSEAPFDDSEMEEAGKEVSRTLLMLRRASEVAVQPAQAVQSQPVRIGIRVCDLLG
ncbi:uncharacterized protein V1516DRAFT_669753 [Lipomyces oligophaga]|uniref:uncharacterized protein n=1 Tax=Lipomyces oligophaga TaxID=45792 RepID=UPI0034CDE6F8